MDSYECTEIINLENLHKLLESSKVSVDHKTYLKKLQGHMKKNTHHSLTFVTSAKLGSRRMGRLYAKYGHPSLQICPRGLRGALGTNYVEIDIVNCFPTVFLQLFQKNNIAVPISLEEYVEDRDAFVAKCNMDKAQVKSHINSVMNFGQTLNPVIEEFGQTFQEAFKALLNLGAYTKYFDYAKARCESLNKLEPFKKAVHFVGSDIERQAIMCIITQFQENGYETSTVIHDGFLLRTNHDPHTLQESVQPMLDSAQRQVESDLGFKVKLAVKTLDFKPEELFDESCAPFADDDMTDHTAAEIFRKYLTDNGYHLRKSNSVIYMYNPNTHLWSDKIVGWRQLASLCLELGVYGQSTPKQNNMWVQLADTYEDESDLLVEMHEACKLKMAWNNGYYDFATAELKPYDEDSHNLGFFDKVKWDWEDHLNEELVSLILNNCVYGVFLKEQGDYLLQALGRAAAGYVEDKLMYIVLGNTNSGKGVLMTLLEKSFGKMVGTFNSGVLAHKQVQDEAKGLSFMVALKDKRFLIGSEASRACVFDSQKINMMASGGDTITARQNNKDEMEFKMCGTGFLFCNDMSKINGLDDSVANRLRFIEPAYSFLSGDMYERKKNQTNVRRADDTIKTWFVKRDDVAATFAQMVCMRYDGNRPVEPACVKRQNNDWLDAEDISEALGKLFETVANNVVPFKDFLKRCMTVESLRTVSANKISRTMSTSFNVKCENATPPHIGRQVKCLLGIRLLGTDDNFCDF